MASLIRVALAGNPNAGKTTIFNALTGARQRVGNYPGVTVERRAGEYHDPAGRCFEVHDLPGTYSLSSLSPEERIAQHELTAGGLDVVVVVVDATTLRRGLVLLAQVMQLGHRLVLCLNMADEAARAGQRLDLGLMEQLLGLPVVETVGHRGVGLDRLKQAIATAATRPRSAPRLVLGERLDRALAAIDAELPRERTARLGSWTAMRLLVGDEVVAEAVQRADERGLRAVAEAAAQRRRIEEETGRDIALFVTERYFGFASGLLREARQQPARPDARATSDRIDAVLAHRWLGGPLFLLVMYVIFWIAFTVGEVPMGWIEDGVAHLAAGVGALWPVDHAAPLRSLLVDGLIGGVGGVVVFLPNIVLLFVCLGLLEDTGYLARAAFLVDRLMHRFGLHGKSFIPLVTGFGCSIPGIMATRTLENERDRLATMLVLPLMSCGARLPIWMLLIPAFFPAPLRAPMLWLIYVVGVALALVLVLLLRRTILRGEEAPFVMELPPYRLPTARGVLRKASERSWLYLKKAGTVILAISLLMWFITSYPKKPTYDVDARAAASSAAATALTAQQLEQARRAEDLSHSIAGRMGRALEPLIAPLGFDWKIGTALLGAFAAKEVFVAQMGIVYSLGEVDETSAGLRQTLARDYSPLVGFSLMLFLLVATPCMATFAVTRRESGSWRWAVLQFAGLTVVAYLLALVFYQGGRLITTGTLNADALAIALAVGVATLVLARRLARALGGRAVRPTDSRSQPRCGGCTGCAVTPRPAKKEVRR